ncbi:TIGR02281 family clan AA aspartic protease [Leeia sp.]|uniref:retropepsin-like aspartic protease family protein n=1 Tax=Leeia sp. TaxID=2884678 RepID=UPI0035AFE0BB
MRIKTGLAALLACCILSAAATQVEVIGVMPGMAVVKVDGSGPKTLRVGQSQGSVKLLAVDGSSATFDIDGSRSRIAMGSSSFSTTSSDKGKAREVLTADGNGHFVTTVQVNGHSVQALVDTGATTVSMSAATARQLGLEYRNGQRAVSQTANGLVPVWIVRWDTVRLGTITLYQVEGAVIEADMPGVLLGMSFLNRVKMVRGNGQLELVKN